MRSSSRFIANLLGLVVLVSLLAQVPVVAAESAGPGAAGSASRATKDDEPDVPTLPPSCFGPAQEEGDPRPCPLNKQRPGRPTLVLWGDSHAHQWIPALRRIGRDRDVNMVSFVAGACPPIAVRFSRRGGYAGKCGKSNAIALKYVRDLHQNGKEVTVLLGSNWSGYRIAYRRIVHQGRGKDYLPFVRKMVKLSHSGTPRLFRRLSRIEVRTAIIAQSATVPDGAPACAEGQDPYLCPLDRSLALPQEAQEDRWLAGQIAPLQGRTRIVDPRSAYCDPDVCFGLVDGIQTWSDELHLSATRTRSLAGYFELVFSDFKS
ncbi:MAG: SGNH hydrolase domain-containing protein [Nocardioides sp.]